MEITKTEKFDLSQIAVRQTARSPLTTRVQALMPGEGFIVDGTSRELISSKTEPLRKEGRAFTTHKLGLNRFRVVRIA